MVIVDTMLELFCHYYYYYYCDPTSHGTPLNWILDPAPIPPRNNGKEKHSPPAEPLKLPRKMRPCRKRKEHHHHLGTTGSAPGTSQPPRCAMSTPLKHPQPSQLPQYPQPPSSAANHNSARPDLLDQAELGRLYKPACPSISKDTRNWKIAKIEYCIRIAAAVAVGRLSTSS